MIQVLQSHRNNRNQFYSSLPRHEKLRVAIVGGGVSGLAAALHLSELVSQGKIAGPIDLYSDTTRQKSRDIGVGIWSTAIAPLSTTRPSHQLVRECLNKHGTYLKNVGYRTIDGSWLCKSVLTDPTLLFLRESDLIQSLQKGVHFEENCNTIRTFKTSVTGIFEESTHAHSTNLLLHSDGHVPKISERDYHLIIAADGMQSNLRSLYGGYETTRTRLTGAAALQNSEIDVFRKSQHAEHIGFQDRNYTVFRGNCPKSRQQLNQADISFQTWGNEKSMRFASVPMNILKSNVQQEHQVWFATIHDDKITNEPDAQVRQEKLLEAFGEWHDPIRETIALTPPDNIIFERGMAHKHSMGPIVNFHSVVETIRGKRPPSSGEGPCIVFVGDALMAIDPILAQGFTVAMEGAANLRETVEHSVKDSFDPIVLRREIKHRHLNRVGRVICLLRTTELVQAMGQPGSRLSGWFQRFVLRPATKLVPNFVKAPIFDAVLRYSLGLGLFHQIDKETKK